MKVLPTLLVVALVALLAFLEYAHEHGDDDAPDGLMCVDPATQRKSLDDLVLIHMRSHR